MCQKHGWRIRFFRIDLNSHVTEMEAPATCIGVVYIKLIKTACNRTASSYRIRYSSIAINIFEPPHLCVFPQPVPSSGGPWCLLTERLLQFPPTTVQESLLSVREASWRRVKMHGCLREAAARLFSQVCVCSSQYWTAAGFVTRALCLGDGVISTIHYFGHFW